MKDKRGQLKQTRRNRVCLRLHVFLHPVRHRVVKLFEISHYYCCSHHFANSPPFSSPGRPIAHQPPPDAHKLLPVCHGHHNVLLRSHQGPAGESTANQRGLLP